MCSFEIFPHDLVCLLSKSMNQSTVLDSSLRGTLHNQNADKNASLETSELIRSFPHLNPGHRGMIRQCRLIEIFGTHFRRKMVL